MPLDPKVQAAIDQYEVKASYLNDLVTYFVDEAAKGLAKDTPRGIPMIPSFVTRIPTGQEKGLFLAADLGGSNFRVCSVTLNGDSTHKIKQMKWAVPHAYMSGSAVQFWNYLADRVHEFLEANHPEKKTAIAKDAANKLDMGFTFSFPIHQTGINRGTLIRWTKGYDIKDAVGTDICEEFQKALDSKNIPVYIAAIVNDTVGCLLARSYEAGAKSQTVIGSILGTGTNAAYSDKIKRIIKLKDYDPKITNELKNEKIMIVNTEWGSFDNDLTFLPNTEIDKQVNLATPNPDFHMFEKRVSGMFLGEIVRRTLLKLHKEKALFTGAPILENANFFTEWSTDTSFLSIVAADLTEDLISVAEQLNVLGVSDSTLEERAAVKDISHAVALRSARLVAGILAGLLKKIRAFEKFEVVDIGVDGAVIEFYPGYEKMIREALREIEVIGPEKERKTTIGISKDGSGIGGALCAAMASTNYSPPSSSTSSSSAPSSS